MTDVTTLLAGIRATLTAATRGPWEEKTDCREKPSVWKDEEYAFPIGMCADHNCEAVYEEADAVFIASAPATVARLLAALEAVTGLHKPVEVYEIDPMNGTWIYDGDEQRVMATLCRECTGDSVLESIGDCEYDETDYHDETPWPCPTITAVVAALGGGE